MKNMIKRLVPIALILILWYLCSYYKVWSAYVLPSPMQVWNTFMLMVQSGELFVHICASLNRVMIGFSIAFVFAFILGIIAGLKPSFSPYYNHIVEFFRNVPPLSLIPLLILWVGIGEESKVIIIILASFFPMFLNIKKGFASCNPKLLEVGKVLGLNARQRFLKIILPSAVPDIFLGMKVGLGYSWRAIIGAEMIAAASGLGYFILDAQTMSRSDKVIVGIIVIGLLGVFCDKIFTILTKKFTHIGGVKNSWD
ncbi:ABC transporter permease [Bacillus massiliigorillae]|uniref:ABC transporter permease n=1 Tax=Bacillus massiliigorillae TaxID=1243664 RepID=UPI0005AA2795|nr:ABC transporter permease [Bacillus massiliigorillae]